MNYFYELKDKRKPSLGGHLHIKRIDWISQFYFLSQNKINPVMIATTFNNHPALI